MATTRIMASIDVMDNSVSFLDTENHHEAVAYIETTKLTSELDVKAWVGVVSAMQAELNKLFPSTK